jgi:hypothetical protein
MSEDKTEYDEEQLQRMNEKAMKNEFFVPDQSYIELGLMKDIPLGCVFMEHVTIKQSKPAFEDLQTKLEPRLKDYQTRVFDTVDPYLSDLGYTDKDIEEILSKPVFHDHIFLLAPMTKFFNLLIRHTIRNSNHSKPANKFTKKRLDKKQYVLEPVQVTYRINTYPLQISPTILAKVAIELGESFGVNISFMCKDPSRFDRTDWDTWMEKTDCFYLDSLGRLARSPFFIEKQGLFQFMGCYFFVRKRFEKHIKEEIKDADFENEIQLASSRMSLFCEFEWLQNNDLRLTEEAEDVPMTEDQVSP